MNLEDPLTRTLWDWLKIELRLYALERGSDLYEVSYEFEDEEDDEAEEREHRAARLGACCIYAKHVQTMVAEGADRAEQLSYYEDWVASERQQIRRISRRMAGEAPPGLEDRFDYYIMHSYGMGSVPICEFRGAEVRWVGSAEPDES